MELPDRVVVKLLAITSAAELYMEPRVIPWELSTAELGGDWWSVTSGGKRAWLVQGVW